MNKFTPKVICDHCGQEVYQRALNIKNFHAYDTSSKEAYVDSLVSLEGVAKEVAISWAEHGLFESCKTAVRNCPKNQTVRNTILL